MRIFVENSFTAADLRKILERVLTIRKCSITDLQVGSGASDFN
jgi:hypothetical protein